MPNQQGFYKFLMRFPWGRTPFSCRGQLKLSAPRLRERLAKRIVLIDGAELTRLMVQHNVGVRTRTIYEVKKVDEDYFSE